MDSKSLIYQFDDVRVDLGRFEVMKADVRIRLEPKAFETLVFLIQNRGQLVEKNELLDVVWKDSFVTENAMTRIIAQLRKGLGDASKEAKYIETVPTRGYRFIAEVEVTKPQESESGLTNQYQSPEALTTALAPAAAQSVALGITSKTQHLLGRVNLHKKGAAVVSMALIVTTAVAVYFARVNSSGAGDKAIDSVAVLPFINISNEPNTEYLSDGITESIIHGLSQVSSLKVMSLNSVLRYKGRDPQLAAHDLSVRAVVVGRVAQRGDSLAINAELVDAQDNHVLWTQNYNRKISDLIVVQEEMSREISEKLRLRLSGEEKRRLNKRYTDNPEAYQLYITGQYYLKKNSAEARKKAVEYFDRALERDPNYALPYTGLAQAYVVLAGAALPPAEAMPKAEAAAIKALEIDGELAAAHVSLSLVKVYYQWDWSGAEREFKRAIELSPDAADTHREYGLILAVEGRRDESISELERAQELEPFSVSTIYGAGVAYLFAGQTDRSIELFRATLEMDPTYVASHHHLSEAYVRKGMYQEAIKEAQTAISLSSDNPLFYAQLGRIYALSGKKGEAVKVLGELKEMSRRRQVSPYYSAEIYAGLGERDQAFALLEEAYKERFRYLVFLKVSSVWDSLRSDPRFTDLLQRIGLPQ